MLTTRQRHTLHWAIVSTFFTLLMLVAVRIFLSSLYSIQANNFLDDWSARQEQPQSRSWDIAHKAIQRAIIWHPSHNPNLYISRGRIYDWRYYRMAIGDPAATASRTLALADYRRAAQLQPTWPYTWVDIALVKTRLGMIDQEMLEALKYALKSGHWRPEVLLKITRTGFFAWNMLPAHGKSLIVTSVDRALASKSAARQASSILKDFEPHSDICRRLINGYTYLKQWCDSQSSTTQRLSR